MFEQAIDDRTFTGINQDLLHIYFDFSIPFMIIQRYYFILPN